MQKSHVQSSTKASIKEQLQRLDLPGYVSFTPAVVMLLLAIEWGGVTYAWNSATIIGLFCGSVGALAIFIVLERRARDEAMFPIAIVCQRKVICTGVVSFLSSGGALLIPYYLPIWFQVVQDTSPTMGGVRLLPTIGALALGSMAAGAIGTYTLFLIPCISYLS